MYIRDVVPYCTLENAYLDVALLASETQKARGRKEFKILLGLLEIKKRIGEEDYQRHVAQTVCYMISALAYSRLGALRNKTPLVALLVVSVREHYGMGACRLYQQLCSRLSSN